MCFGDAVTTVLLCRSLKCSPSRTNRSRLPCVQPRPPFFRNLFRRRGQKHFWGLPRPPDVELDSKGKGDFEGLGETEGGGRGQLLRERAQTAAEHYCVMPKGETEHTNISQRRQHWAKCVLCLSDVVVLDGFLTRLLS